MYPDMKIADVVPEIQYKFTVQKYKYELGRPYLKTSLYFNAKKRLYV